MRAADNQREDKACNQSGIQLGDRSGDRLGRFAIATAAAWLAAWCGACGSSEVAAPERAPDVFLISLDTFRKDAVGAYRDAGTAEVARQAGASGGSNVGRPGTPALDAFALDAVLIDGARSPMPFTLPAHMSLLTSTAPRVHGVSRGNRVLSDRLGTLPEWLRAAGFETHGVAVNYWMKGDFGFARGFDSYQLVQQGLVSSGRVNEALREILDRVGAARADSPARPLFVFAQFFDAHSASSALSQNTLPYYSPPGYRGDLASHTLSGEGDFCSAASGCATGFLVEADATERPVDAGTLAQLRDLYDRSAAHQDAQLGDFLRELKRRGLYEAALVIVTADHGEAFREHGRFLHSQTYDETIALPLLVKLPAQTGTRDSTRIGGGRAGTRVGGLATLEDIAPTILELLGLPIPETAQGLSLVPLILRGEAVRQEMVSQDKIRRSRHALIADGYKLIYDFAGGAVELYDLEGDPGETRNLSAGHPQRTAALQRRLLAQVAENTRLAERFRAQSDGALLSEREQESLRALGYLDEPQAGAPAPD